MQMCASLLFQRQPAVSFDTLFSRLLDHSDLAEMGLRLIPEPDGKSALFATPRLHMRISLSNRPVAARHLRSALDAPFARMRNADYEMIVNRHRAHIALSVEDGPIRPCLADHTLAEQYQTSPQELLEMLNTLLQTMLDLSEPTAVHWGQSNMLFLPKEARVARDWRLPLPLMVRPSALSAGYDALGNRRLGLRLELSETLVDGTLIVEPDSRPLHESLALALSVMRGALLQDLPIHHGAQIVVPGMSKVYVRREPPTPRDPKGRVVLTATAPVRRAASVRSKRKPTPWMSRRALQVAGVSSVWLSLIGAIKYYSF